MIKTFSVALFLFIAACGYSQIREDENLIVNLMLTQPQKFRNYLLNSSQYEIQIIYTQVKRDSLGQPQLQNYTYQVNPKVYFNPASLVKLPTALLALEKLNELNRQDINKYTRIAFGTSFACQTPLEYNRVRDKDFPSIARLIEQTFLVSDNDAYTRLYEFLGQAYTQDKLNKKGYSDMRIIRRFTECDTLQNRHTNPVFFYDSNGQLLYKQDAQFNSSPHQPPLGKVKKGIAYLDNFGRKVNQPIDFTFENFLSLPDMHQLLVSVMMPELIAPEKRFNLTDDDYAFLRKGLGAFPNEGNLANYTLQNGYFDNYKKYLYHGRKGNRQEGLRIYNIVGWWAGYLSDCAYFVDSKNNLEFYLSAVIYVNKNQIFDYNFEYETEGFPFLADLGKLVYAYELRKKLESGN